MVFASIFPTETDAYEDLRDAMEKLRLNDASFTFEPESSTALGFGFRCGYLGLLHMEIIQERLEREFNLSLITTAPSVPYLVKTTRGQELEISNPVKLPEVQLIDEIQEPYILATIITKDEFLGGILALGRGAARHAGLARIRGHAARRPQVRAPAERGHPRLLRQAQVALARLRLLRLPAHRLPARRPREARHPHQRRARGRPRVHRPPRQGAGEGPRRSSRR